MYFISGGLKCKVLVKLMIVVLPILFVMILVAALTITLGFASPDGSETKHDAYLGDMITLFSVGRWFWLESVLVKGEPALQDEQEVKLYSVACDSVKGYATFSHIEPGHTFNIAAPFPILDHHLSDISNYFATASGNITVNMTIWSKDHSELSLCYFDCYDSYENFIQRVHVPKAKEEALNCTEYQSTAEPKTVISEYSPTHPSYYFVAIAANSPISLQYTVDLWHEVFNQSDYVAENCSITRDCSCKVALPPSIGGQQLCILAYYCTGLEDFITLQAETKHHDSIGMLVAGFGTIFVLICVSVASCGYIIRREYVKNKKNYNRLPSDD